MVTVTRSPDDKKRS